MIISEKEIVIRLVLTFILSGILGFERQKNGKNAGFKTHILVALGACLVTTNGVFLYQHYPNADPMRMSAQVISGIGFLGSGLILKDNNYVKGLTTAASVWLAGCIGISVGSGFYLGATVTIFLILFTLIIPRWIKKINQDDKYCHDKNDVNSHEDDKLHIDEEDDVKD